MRRQLADEDHAGGFEPRGGLGVRRRDIVEQQPRMRGRAQPGGVVDVLQAVGDAVQRTAATPARDLPLGALGGGAGALRSDLDKGVELGLQRFGAGQRRLGQSDRRQFAGGDLAPGLGQGRQRRGAHRLAPKS